MKLLLKTIAHIGKVVIRLRILLTAGGRGPLSQFLQLPRPDGFQLFLACQDIHGKLFIVFSVQGVHLVQHRHVLHQSDLMPLQHLDNFIHVCLCLGILCLQSRNIVFLLLEKAKNAALFLLSKVFQFSHQSGQILANFTKIFGAYFGQRTFRKPGNILLRRRSILKDQIRIGHVDFFRKIRHDLPLRFRQHGLIQLHGVGVPYRLIGLLHSSFGSRRVQRQRRCFYRSCPLKIRGQGQFRGHIHFIAHDRSSIF